MKNREESPWFGRIVFEREGIEREHKFNTKEEADAYVLGFVLAKQLIEDGLAEGEFN